MIDYARRKKFILLSILVIIVAGGVSTILYFNKHRPTADVSTSGTGATSLLPHIKIYTTIYDNLTATTKKWLQDHVDLGTVTYNKDSKTIFGAVIDQQIVHVNWRDIDETGNSGVDPELFFDLVKYFEAKNLDPGAPFLHYAKDVTSSVRVTSQTTPGATRAFDAKENRADEIRLLKAGTSLSGLPGVDQTIDWTSEAYGDKPATTYPTQFSTTIGSAETAALLTGYACKYNEINLTFSQALVAPGALLEYWTGQAWSTLVPSNDGTNGLTQSGKIAFTPPSDWSPGLIGQHKLYWTRLRSTDGLSFTLQSDEQIVKSTEWEGVSAVSLKAYDRTPDRTKLIIPGWDGQNDVNSDGYVDDTEFANKVNPTAQARFKYQSRVPASYLTGRWLMNFGDGTYREFADGWSQELKNLSQSIGIFIDNSSSAIAAAVTPTGSNGYLEYSDNADAEQKKVDFIKYITSSHPADISVINSSLTSPASASSSGVMIESQFSYQSSSLMTPTYLQSLYDGVKLLTGQGKKIILGTNTLWLANSNPDLMDATTKLWLPDAWPRAQIENLAMYYLLASNQTYFELRRNTKPWDDWAAVIGRDIGKPVSDYRLVTTDAAQNSSVYSREYDNALIVVKTTSHDTANTDIGEDTRSTIPLDRRYYPLSADNQRQTAVDSISLRNFDGAILLKNLPPVWSGLETQSVKAGETLRLDLLVVDPEGAPLTLQLVNPISGASIETSGDSKQLVYTASSAQIGNQTITVTASDGELESQTTIEITVVSADSTSSTSNSSKNSNKSNKSSGSQPSGTAQTSSDQVSSQPSAEATATKNVGEKVVDAVKNAVASLVNTGTSFQLPPRTNRAVGIAAAISAAAGLSMLFLGGFIF